MKYWLVGKSLLENGKEIGWMPEGIFAEDEEDKAAASALEISPEDCFIVLVTVGEIFPKEAKDAEKLYYPVDGGWEDSELYKMRQST